MRKNNIKFSVVTAIFLAFYHLLVFFIPFLKNDVFWLSYGFTIGAFVVAVIACIVGFRSASDIDSKLFGFPIAKVGVYYLAAQIIVSLVFMTFSRFISLRFGAVVYTVMLLVAVLGLIAKDTVRDHIRNQDVHIRVEASTLCSIQEKVNLAVAQCNDRNVSLTVKKLAEEIRFSDPLSSPTLASIEGELMALVDELQKAITDEDSAATLSLCNRAQLILTERNRLCKAYKKDL